MTPARAGTSTWRVPPCTSAVVAVDDLRWGASPNGSIVHLVDVRGVPYCGRTFRDEPEITTGFLPAWKWWGYLVCVDCPHHVELDDHEIAAPRRTLAVDELPTPRRCGRHAIETLDAPPQ